MRPRIALVSGVESRHTEALLAAGAGLASVEVIDPGQLSVDLQQAGAPIRYRGRKLTAFDGALLRRISPSIDFDFQMQVLREWSRILPVSINSVEGMLLAMDKLAIQLRLRQAGLPIPATWVVTDASLAETIVRRQGVVVAKPLYGSMGEGLQLWRDDPGLLDSITTFLGEHGVVMLQEYVPLSEGDARVFVIGDRAVAASMRTPAPGDWRTNLSQGGGAVALEVTDELATLAVGAVKAAGLDYSGVDLLPADDGWKILEVNGAPSFLGLRKATGIDIPRLLMEHVVQRCEAARLSPETRRPKGNRSRAA